MQTAYQVQVDEEWDSGKIASSDSIEVFYDGKTLKSGQNHRWRVRVWDQEEKPSEWSKTTHFFTGIIEPDEWRSKWISSPENRIEKTSPLLQDAQWIWASRDTKLPLPAPLGTCSFTREFELSSSIQSANIHLAADSRASLYINEQLIAETKECKRGIIVSCKDVFSSG
jgi:alpha-L-rhamnosidase